MGNRAGRLIKTYQSPHQRGLSKPKFLAAKQVPNSIAAKVDPRLGAQYGYMTDLPQYVNHTPYCDANGNLKPDEKETEK